MIHQKVSCELNTDPGLVGGEDWDAPHVYPVGASFLFGLAGASFDSGVVTEDYLSGGVTAIAYNDTTHRISLTLDVASLPVPDGANHTPRIAVSMQSDTFVAQSPTFFSYDAPTGALVLEVGTIAGGAAEFSAPVVLTIQVFLDVSAGGGGGGGG